MGFRMLESKELPACTKAFVEIFNDEPWNDEWTLERAAQYITDFYHTPHFLGVLAVEQEEIIGFAYGVTRAWYNGNEFYIHEMGVKKDWRNQGVGRALLNQLMEKLEDEEISNFALLTDRGMPAELFYKKIGFREVERLVFYTRDF